AIDHRLGDFGLERPHALDALGRDIVALVVDDQVFLPVGDPDPALLIQVADISRAEPAVAQPPRGPLRVAPIAVHDQLAADHDLAVVGDAHLGVLHRRADGVEPDPGA